MKAYPTRNGIAVPVFEINLPSSTVDPENPDNFNNHHNEWTRRRMGELSVTQALRDLERHQFVMPIDVHNWLHANYSQPEMPTTQQAAIEVIDAYDKGEQFRLYEPSSESYYTEGISKEFVDSLVREHGLYIYVWCYTIDSIKRSANGSIAAD